jgi:O-antigen/teichoic acid export membrane protein
MKLVRNFLKGKNINEHRDKRVKKASISSLVTLVNRGITIGTGLVSIPLTAHYLGTERFGMWLTLSSFLTWVSLADLGLANSLTNALATADGKDNQKQAREMLSSTIYLMLAVIIVIVLCLTISYPLIPWAKIFNVKSVTAISEVEQAVLVSLVIFVLRLPLSIPKRIYDAYQDGYIYQFYSIVGSLLSFIALVVAIQHQEGLPLLIASYFGVTLLGDLLAATYLFTWQKPWLVPKPGDFRWENANWLMKTGMLMWISQISAIIIFQTDLIIVAQLFGASEVASYGVTLKIFSLVSTIASAFLSPLWGSYSEALARNDIPWIAKVFKRSIFLNLFWSLPLGILLSVFSPSIVSSWVAQDAIPSNLLILAMLMTSLIGVVSNCVGILMAGLCEVSLSAKVGILQGITNILLSIFLARILGVSGVAWATGICLLIFSVGIMGNEMRKKLNILLKEYKLNANYN